MAWRQLSSLAVQSFVRLLCQTVTILLMAAGFVGALISSFIIGAMVISWFQDGMLLAPDRTLLGEGSIWLLVALFLVGVARWFYFKTVAKQTGDNSFRLVKSSSREDEARAFRISEILFFGALAIWLGANLTGNVISRIPFVIGWTFIGLLGSYFCIFLHEFGHLGVAWCLRMKVQKMQVGVGPLIWSHRTANGFQWEWRGWPYGGFTFAVPATTECFRVRQFLFVAGGPLMDAIFLSSIYWIITSAFGGLGDAWLHGPIGIVMAVSFWRHAIAASHGLVPLSFWVENQPTWTDGYWLVRLLTGSKAAIAQLASATQMIEWINSSPTDVTSKRQTSEVSENLPSFAEQQGLLSSQLLRLQGAATSSPPD